MFSFSFIDLYASSIFSGIHYIAYKFALLIVTQVLKLARKSFYSLNHVKWQSMSPYVAFFNE